MKKFISSSRLPNVSHFSAPMWYRIVAIWDTGPRPPSTGEPFHLPQRAPQATILWTGDLYMLIVPWIFINIVSEQIYGTCWVAFWWFMLCGGYHVIMTSYTCHTDHWWQNGWINSLLSLKLTTDDKYDRINSLLSFTQSSGNKIIGLTICVFDIYHLLVTKW